MQFLKGLKKNAKPNIELLKAKHDVEGLIEAMSYNSKDPSTDIKFAGSAALALGDLGDVRAIQPIKKLLDDLTKVENMWKELDAYAPLAAQTEKTKQQFEDDQKLISALRPALMDILKSLTQKQAGTEN